LIMMRLAEPRAATQRRSARNVERLGLGLGFADRNFRDDLDSQIGPAKLRRNFCGIDLIAVPASIHEAVIKVGEYRSRSTASVS
jgi:hypothetical protein